MSAPSESAESPRYLADAIRILSADAVQRAASGHPGAPMGMADIAEALWNGFMVHNPANPGWSNRDRFVLSNGHGSMLLYSLLHLTGYDLSIEDIRNFRQLHSRTPGHPEYGITPGVETTTGPLGQGMANAVGMAIAERTLAARFNRDGYQVVDHHTWVFMGDGCMMEGISHEAGSLAGALGLGKLIAFWDDNGISIDGEVSGWFIDDTPARFEAYGWQVVRDVDGHDHSAVRAAIETAREETGRPTLICCKTRIGYGSPNKEGKESSHGAPLGDDEIVLVREKLGWDFPPFEIPNEVYAGWDAREQGAQAEQEWDTVFSSYRDAYPELANEYERRVRGELPEEWNDAALAFVAAVNDEGATVASRKASQKALDGLGPMLPELIGGSADLTGSNCTYWGGSRTISADNPDGNYLFFGVREFAMSAVINGISLHGGFKPYGATFLVFSDYARNALRMAAIMNQPSLFAFTHDSIGLGEDGPTHQAVEHLACLRLIPNMSVWRPCDAVETAVAWKVALERSGGPVSLAFSRQSLPHQARDSEQLTNIERGGYILLDSDADPDLILIATGSEVALACSAVAGIKAEGFDVRVVSMPCTNAFDAQDSAYRDTVLPPTVNARIAIEAGSSDYWRKYVGRYGEVLGMESFGESAPADVLFQHFGFTEENLLRLARGLLDHEPVATVA
jgi:transketolase